MDRAVKLSAKAVVDTANIITKARITAKNFFMFFLLSNIVVVFFSIISYNLVIPLQIGIAITAM